MANAAVGRDPPAGGGHVRHDGALHSPGRPVGHDRRVDWASDDVPFLRLRRPDRLGPDRDRRSRPQRLLRLRAHSPTHTLAAGVAGAAQERRASIPLLLLDQWGSSPPSARRRFAPTAASLVAGGKTTQKPGASIGRWVNSCSHDRYRGPIWDGDFTLAIFGRFRPPSLPPGTIRSVCPTAI